MDFHNALAESTGNQVSEMMKVITKMVQDYSFDFMAVSAKPKKSTTAARQIVQLVARGEGEKAAEVMREHLCIIDAKLKDLLTETVKNDKD